MFSRNMVDWERPFYSLLITRVKSSATISPLVFPTFTLERSEWNIYFIENSLKESSMTLKLYVVYYLDNSAET